MIKRSKNKNQARGQSWTNREVCVKKWWWQNKNKFIGENVLSLNQTLDNLPHPLKIPKSQCSKTHRALITTNLTIFPNKASEKALSYCSDFISAEDQLKGHWRAMILEAGCASSTLYLAFKSTSYGKGPHVRIIPFLLAPHKIATKTKKKKKKSLSVNK